MNSELPKFTAVYPIGHTNTNALPVRELGAAIAYYTQVLGFELVAKTEHGASLCRGTATIGLALNKDDPDQASCYFEVTNVDALRAELAAKHVEPSPMRTEKHGGNDVRLFFAKEPYGVCFCFGE